MILNTWRYDKVYNQGTFLNLVPGKYLQVQQGNGLGSIGVKHGCFQVEPGEELLEPVAQGWPLGQQGPLQAKPAQVLQVSSMEHDRTYRTRTEPIEIPDVLENDTNITFFLQGLKIAE